MNAPTNVVVIAAAMALQVTSALADTKSDAETRRKEFLHRPVFQNNRSEDRRAAAGAIPPKDAAPANPNNGRRPDAEEPPPSVAAVPSPAVGKPATTAVPSVAPAAPVAANTEPEASDAPSTRTKYLSYVVMLLTFGIFLWSRKRSRK